MFHHVVTRLARVLLVALVLAGLSVTASSTAGAADAKVQRAGCVGAACTDQDANAMGCGTDATTIDEFTGVHANSGRSVRVELRQSRVCRARWLRVTPGGGSGGCSDNSHIRLLDYNANNVVVQSRYSTFNLCEGQIITLMIGRASNSDRSNFCYRGDPYGWDSHPTYAPCKGRSEEHTSELQSH